jgi:hypothetical protein
MYLPLGNSGLREPQRDLATFAPCHWLNAAFNNPAQRVFKWDAMNDRRSAGEGQLALNIAE